MRRVLFVLATLLVVSSWVPWLSAHQSIINSLRLETRPREKRLSASFRLNGLTVRDWLKSRGSKIEIANIGEARDDLVAYVKAHFTVTAGGKPCPYPERGAYVVRYEPRRDAVLLTTGFRCGEATQISIVSTLFDEHPTSQDLIVSIDNGGKRGRYFMNSKGRSRIDVDLEGLTDIRGAFLSHLHGPGAGSAAASSSAPPGAATPSASSAAAATAAGDTAPPPSPAGSAYASGVLGAFLSQLSGGFFHILDGVDHILFVVALLVAVRSWRELGTIITSFTLAHSITLVLSALQLLQVSPRLAEPLIAASVAYVAIENVFRAEPVARPRVTFLFGLLHGLGFGGGLHLQGIDFSVNELIGLVLGFNLGVEAGQLAIVAPLFPLLMLWRKRDPENKSFPYARIGVSGAVALLGIAWTLDRALALGMMPF